MRANKNLHLPGVTVRSVVKAGLADDWSELIRSEELNPWMMAQLKERHSQARQEDEQRKSIAQLVLQRSTDFLRRITAPVKGPMFALIATGSPSMITFGGSRRGTVLAPGRRKEGKRKREEGRGKREREREREHLLKRGKEERKDKKQEGTKAGRKKQ